MRLGARVFKTGITVVLTLLLTHLIGLGPSIIAGIASVFALQPNVHRSLMTTWNQCRGNTLGAIAAIIMAILFGNNVLIIGLTVVLVLSTLLFFKLQSVSTLAVVTVIAIMDAPQLTEVNATTIDFLESAGIRFSLVMIGVLSSLIVNLVFIPPKYETKLYHNCFNITSDIFKWIRLELSSISEYQIVKNDIESLRSRVITLETMYLWYKEEKNYFRRGYFREARRKILFKHLTSSTRRSFELLRKMNRFENDFVHLDEDYKQRIRFELEQLMTFHEQIFMKVTQKIRPDVDIELYDSGEYDTSLLDEFNELYNKAETEDEKLQYTNIVQLLASIYEYSSSLDRLNRLASSFFKYHAEQNKINIQDETLDI
ncbi:FUSC family protein [Corticicoccus populi]|uniref:Aromatic acid exporter family protein n=1 Tax=Corticicoccus populi TaxID=1812821 RepID=A0ABW5X0I0_9STAP